MDNIRKTHYWALGIITLLSILCFFDIRPVHFDDTGGYLSISYLINMRQLWPIDGARTPMYPLFLVVAAKLCKLLHPDFAVQAVSPYITSSCATLITMLQFGLLLISNFIFYRVLVKVAGAKNALLAAILAIIVLGFPVNGWFSRIILTESLADSLTCLATAVLLLAFMPDNRGSRRFVYLASGLMCMSVMTRPNMLVPAAIFFVFIAVQKHVSKILPITWETLALGAMLFTMPILCWMTFNLANAGYFRITTIPGLCETPLIAQMWDRIPVQHKPIADIMRHYYVPGSPREPMIVPRAYTELCNNIGALQVKRRLPYPWTVGVDMSHYLETVVRDTVREHKLETLMVIAHETPKLLSRDFDLPVPGTGDPGTYDGEDNVRYVPLHRALYVFSTVDGILIVLLELLSYAALLFLLVYFAARRRLPALITDNAQMPWLGVGALLCFVLGQLAYLPFGYYESVRYTLPLLPFLLLSGVILGPAAVAFVSGIVRSRMSR